MVKKLERFPKNENLGLLLSFIEIETSIFVLIGKTAVICAALG